MSRAYYSNSIDNFIKEYNDHILGQLSRNHNHALEDLQKNAWLRQIDILKNCLIDFSGDIFFEFSIPRMGKRVDNVLILNGIIFILEFKVGSTSYDKYAIDQVTDYALDLKNFHEGSHFKPIVPILVATEGHELNNDFKWSNDKISNVLKANKNNLPYILKEVIRQNIYEEFDVDKWERSRYKPTPTIIEAAQALYSGHNVQEISRSDSGVINLSKTSDCIYEIINYSKKNNCKSICFVTGVPGAGKTLAGLNIATKSMNSEIDEQAVFLSGNGPLVDVLREALARDESQNKNISKAKAMPKVKTFIQNVHHFRDDGLDSSEPPIEKVVIFDEAQRAWDKEQAGNFMQRKKGRSDFDYSEPEFLIKVMNRHTDWCTIICLIGGGQEINIGEAGLMEWFTCIKSTFPDWHVFYSDKVTDKEYTSGANLDNYLSEIKSIVKTDLHLSTSIRSFRSEKLAEFINLLINNEPNKARETYNKIEENYPIFITREIDKAKEWIKTKARGSERCGLIAHSNAIRLRPDGINVKAKVDPTMWFLNDKDDIRSSYFLEEVATEFDVQGLELDWTIVGWDANLRYENEHWQYHNFSGTKWQNVNKLEKQKYLLNSYRVLLTRARQGMIIYVPQGNNNDSTRLAEYYNGIYDYLTNCGIKNISSKNLCLIKAYK